MSYTLKQLQELLPWTGTYSPEFEASKASGETHRNTTHDVLHVMKGLGRIAAICERMDHDPRAVRPGQDPTIAAQRELLANEVVDLIICGLHMAKTNPFGEFDLEAHVLKTLDRRNGSRLVEEDGCTDHYIIRNPGQAVFVKEGEFFVSQGGLTNEWGKTWKKIKARSIEHAREIGEATLPPWTPDT